MKKLYTIVGLTFLLLQGETIIAQTFTYTNIDAAKSGAPGVELILASTLINSTANPISVRVTRQQDVISEAATWTSAFCMYVCYLPTTDSVTVTFAPMDTIDFTFHMYTSSTADHATASMRWKNIATPSNTFNQSFFGSTDGTLSVNEVGANAANVSIYPMPVVSGDVFTMNISAAKTSAPLSLVVYNMLGSVVSTSPVIAGINFMSLDLPSGMYSYNLVSEGTVMTSGKLSMVK